jgi:hypothetical protein
MRFGLTLLLAVVFLRAAESTLDLGSQVQALPPGNRFAVPGYHVWCGAPVMTEDGKVHLFYSRWESRFGFAPAWAVHSEVAYAVADGPGRPFRHVNVALPARGPSFWDGSATHNPNVLRANGRFYLFYNGNVGDGVYATHRNHQRVGVAVADKPEGPWTRFDHPIVDVSSDPKAFDSLCVTNPAACLRPDGSVLLLYKAVEVVPGKPMGGKVRYGAAVARTPEGPYVKVPGRIFESDQPDAAKHWMLAEDPFVWHDRDAGGYFAVARDVAGVFTGAPGGIALFASADGLNWRPASHPKVLAARYPLADGTISATQLERPALLFQAGRPLALFGATDGYRKDVESANVQIPLSAPRR